MAGFTTQKSGFTQVTDLFLSIATDMVANGFTLAYPTTLPTAAVPPASAALFKATLQFASAAEVAVALPWRVQLDASVAKLGSINVATPTQLPNDGTTALIIPPGLSSSPSVPVGMVNTTGTLPTTSGSTVDNSPFYFIARDGADTSTTVGANANPMSYRLTITDRGFALCVWDDASDAQATPKVSWLVVQRPVDHTTGIAYTTGHAPVFAVYGMDGATSKFVVRENDVLRPSPQVPADSDSEDSRAILNTSNQVSITEDNRYVITFPNGLNTPRYAYTLELDMLAYTSADVCRNSLMCH